MHPFVVVEWPSAYQMLAPTFEAAQAERCPMALSPETHRLAIVILCADVSLAEVELACAVHAVLGRGLLALA